MCIVQAGVAVEAVPGGGARGTRLCYKGGSRAARAQCARVSRVACAQPRESNTRIRSQILASNIMQLLLATCFVLFAATLGPAAGSLITLSLIIIIYHFFNCYANLYNLIRLNSKMKENVIQ